MASRRASSHRRATDHSGWSAGAGHADAAGSQGRTTASAPPTSAVTRWRPRERRRSPDAVGAMAGVEACRSVARRAPGAPSPACGSAAGSAFRLRAAPRPRYRRAPLRRAARPRAVCRSSALDGGRSRRRAPGGRIERHERRDAAPTEREADGRRRSVEDDTREIGDLGVVLVDRRNLERRRSAAVPQDQRGRRSLGFGQEGRVEERDWPPGRRSRSARGRARRTRSRTAPGGRLGSAAGRRRSGPRRAHRSGRRPRRRTAPRRRPGGRG